MNFLPRYFFNYIGRYLIRNEPTPVIGLVKKRPGPKSAHKLTDEILFFIEANIEDGKPLRARKLAPLIKEKFGKDALEAEWNEKLRDLQDANDYYETHRHQESEKLKRAQQKEIHKLAKDFPRLWKNPKTPAREKKRMIRFLIEDVTMTRGEEILLCIRFKGGATKKVSLPLPLRGWQHNVTDPKIVEIVNELLASYTYSEIATILNKRGCKSGQGHRFDRTIVKGITHSHKLKTRFARLRATGKLTADEVASLLCVTVATVRRWGKKGTIKTYPYNDRNGCLYEHPGVNSTLMRNKN